MKMELRAGSLVLGKLLEMARRAPRAPREDMSNKDTFSEVRANGCYNSIAVGVFELEDF